MASRSDGQLFGWLVVRMASRSDGLNQVSSDFETVAILLSLF